MFVKQIQHAVRWFSALVREADVASPGLQVACKWRPDAKQFLIQSDACPSGMGAFLMISGKMVAYWHDEVSSEDCAFFGQNREILHFRASGNFSLFGFLWKCSLNSLRMIQLACRLCFDLTTRVQKNDPTARGAWRSLACACRREGVELCPFHVCKDLVELQLRRLGLSDLSECPVDSIPLIARRSDPPLFAEKTVLIAEAQRFASLLKLHVKLAAG